MCPTNKAGVQQVSLDPTRCTIVLICSGQGMMVYSGSLLSLALCGIMWSRVACPSLTQATHPSPPPYPSHFGLSLLAALQRNGPGWSRPRRSANSQSVISRCQMMWMCIAIYFCTSIIPCGVLLKYLVHLVFIVIILTTAFFNHISSAVLLTNRTLVLGEGRGQQRSEPWILW